MRTTDADTIKAVRLLQRDFARRVKADEVRDIERAKRRPPGGKVGKDGRHALTMGRAAFMNSVNREGPAVLSPDADGYWRDMVRRYPHLRGGGVYDSSAVSANGEVTRLGRVTQRFRDGRWWNRRPDGSWAPAPAPRRDWAAEAASATGGTR